MIVTPEMVAKYKLAYSRCPSFYSEDARIAQALEAATRKEFPPGWCRGCNNIMDAHGECGCRPF